MTICKGWEITTVERNITRTSLQDFKDGYGKKMNEVQRHEIDRLIADYGDNAYVEKVDYMLTESSENSYTCVIVYKSIYVEGRLTISF